MKMKLLAVEASSHHQTANINLKFRCSLNLLNITNESS